MTASQLRPASGRQIQRPVAVQLFDVREQIRVGLAAVEQGDRWWPRARAASTRARPRNTVPPRIKMFMIGFPLILSLDSDLYALFYHFMVYLNQAQNSRITSHSTGSPVSIAQMGKRSSCP